MSVCWPGPPGQHTHMRTLKELPPNPLPQKREDAEDALMSLNGLLLNDYEMKIGCVGSRCTV